MRAWGLGVTEPAPVSGCLQYPGLRGSWIKPTWGSAAAALELTWPSQTVPSISASCPLSCRKTGSPAFLGGGLDRSRRTTAGGDGGPARNWHGLGLEDTHARVSRPPVPTPACTCMVHPCLCLHVHTHVHTPLTRCPGPLSYPLRGVPSTELSAGSARAVSKAGAGSPGSLCSERACPLSVPKCDAKKLTALK